MAMAMAMADGEGQEQQTSILSSLWDAECLTTYHTHKVVLIKSRMLQIPLILFRTSIICGLCLYVVVYKLEFMKKVEDVTGHAMIELIPPLENFWECRDIDVDCKIAASKDEDFQYCSKRTHGVSGCIFLDSEELPNMKYSQVTFIPTSVTYLTQERSQQDAAWVTMNKTTKYIRGIEDFMLKFRAFAYSKACTEGCTSSETQGFFHNQDGSVSRISCSSRNHTSACTFADASYSAKQWDAIDTCGTDAQGSSEMCTATPWGDYISVAKILEAANVSLDDSKGASSLPTRLEGTAMVMQVKFDNAITSEYWSWPVGQKWKYTYSFNPIIMNGIQSNEQKKIIEKPGSGERLIIKFSGIPVLVSTTGDLRENSFLHGCTAMILSLSVITVANLLVEKVLLKVYNFLAIGKHTNALFQMYKHDQSPDVLDFRSRGISADTDEAGAIKVFHDLNQEVELRRAHSAVQKIQSGADLSPRVGLMESPRGSWSLNGERWRSA